MEQVREICSAKDVPASMVRVIGCRGCLGVLSLRKSICSILFVGTRRSCASKTWTIAIVVFVVRCRIESLVKRFLKGMVGEADVATENPSLISRTERNTGAEGEVVHSMYATYQKVFSMGSNGGGFFRVWKVMEICYHLLAIGKQATQREIFYKILSSRRCYVNGQNQVNNAIQDVVAVLLCTRRSLGILASGRGLVAGRLVIEERCGDIVDCSNLGSSAHLISADSNLQQKFYTDARYILVIEKDAIFQRLVEDRFFHKVPCIIMTAKGFPDLASRALLHRLHQQFPRLLIFALVDWNPAGLAIICTYKFGSIRMALEASRYVCDLKWLGLRYGDVRTYVPDNALSKLTDRDVSQATKLLTSKVLQNNESYKQELLEMLAFGLKTEIEALYAHGYEFLAKYITDKIVQRGYI